MTLSECFSASVSLFLVYVSLLSVFPGLISSTMTAFERTGSYIFSFRVLLLGVCGRSFVQRGLLVNSVRIGVD